MVIKNLFALEVLDSRGNPTVEVHCELDNGIIGKAMVPSGASTGEREAAELRDHDPHRYGGKGVKQAVNHVNVELANALRGMQVTKQREIDYAMIDLDGTPNKSRLGANAILGVSLAVAQTAARAMNMPLYRYIGGINACKLPVPCMNVLNGGVHAQNRVDFQEFMIAPHNAPDFANAIRMGVETFHQLKKVLHDHGLNTGVGDEGGYAPDLKSNEEAVEMILRAIEAAGYRPGEDISICLDPATSEMWQGDGTYKFFKSDQSVKTSAEMVELFQGWLKKYPIVLLEDGLGENDWEGWQNMTKELGSRVELVGDDIFVTNKDILQQAIHEGVGNSILIKLNQIGTMTETLETVELAQGNGYNCFVSHRSGETEDTTIADLTVAIGAGHLKTGSGCRGERIAKFNQLLRIERDLGDRATFAGKGTFKHAMLANGPAGEHATDA
ncbi:phosphopyruvate hydratase [Pontibacter sp. G13]|uniref:phosphopyruvate hydratase n=1 Tax=Pontibacter sp. G13 TaxID=3074898 RepID=UPI00288C410D|nr:phosphopyruvate hydratase [Pontibacter sp. G13]WNJ17997.1 phosphopyruvate hydratase [Pontibacter sp. G13]